MYYMPKCLQSLRMAAAWQLLYQLEEQGPSWLGSHYHIVPGLADGQLDALEGSVFFLSLCLCYLLLSRELRSGRSFLMMSVTLVSDRQGCERCPKKI